MSLVGGSGRKDKHRRQSQGFGQPLARDGASPWRGIAPVSYTHLDVYKRQVLTPVAQYILLYHLQVGSIEGMSPRDIARCV